MSALNSSPAVNSATDPDSSADAAYQPIFASLSELENDLDESGRALSSRDRGPSPMELEQIMGRLSEHVANTRRAVGVLQQAQRDERRKLAHDMRVSLGAISGWAHVLRLEKGASSNVTRAADILERNVRALVVLVDALQA